MPLDRALALNVVSPLPFPENVLVPMLILPKFAVIEPASNTPTVVKLDVTTLDPKVVASNISTLLILNFLPVAIFQCSLEVQLSFALSQIIV